MNRINQHHVWRSYLEAWSVNESFACLRNGNVFACQPKNVAAQRYFYRAEELTGSDLAFIEGAFLASMPPILQNIHRDWLRTFNTPFQLLKQLRAKGFDEVKLAEAQRAFENNLIEELHGRIEQTAGKYLNALRRHDARFFSDPEAKTEFLLFLTAQYFRTSKIRANVLASAAQAIKDRIGFDFERIWNPVSHIFATSAAYFLSADNSLRLVLLNNTTTIPFITGDQPVLNTHATSLPLGEQVQQLEFYYPVSPKIAVLVTVDKVSYPLDAVVVDEETVTIFNKHVVGNSLHEIYASSSDQLESISK